MSFDLSIKQCSAGPGHSEFAFARDHTIVLVKDVSEQLHLADGYGAIVICYQNINTLYVFQSDQFPPQEPQLFLNGDEALSIEGAGKVLPLKSGSMMDAMSDLEIRFAESRAKHRA
jgi:hypothetical protein